MATVSFLSDWSHQQSGDIHHGDSLRIEYDAERLPKFRAERYGQRAWSISANLRFHPGGQTQAGDISLGSLAVSVPANTSKIEIWFHNTDHTGGSAWDSSYSQNYWLDVVR